MDFFYIDNGEIRLKMYAFGTRLLSVDKCKLLAGIDKFRLERGLVRAIQKDKRSVVLWFDHSLSGGTEIYSQREIEKRRQSSNIIRVRSNKTGNFYLTLFNNRTVNYFRIAKFELLRAVLESIQISEVVINNIVGYKDPSGILTLVKELMRKETKVTLNVHDFYCICQNCNLMMNNQVFCKLNFKKCAECVKAANVNIDPFRWRQMWKNFLCNSCTEIRVFSASSANIVNRTFPNIEDKVVLIPHDVPYLRKARIKNHTKINIAVLGNVGAVHKGRDVVIGLAEYLERCPDTLLYCIGKFDWGKRDRRSKKLIILGEYKVDQLTEICERLLIDIILIPSICPETFSYTTSEAIMTGLPVASFSLGAQAEKVNIYTRGLILKKQDPEYIITQIKNHLNEVRIGKELRARNDWILKSEDT